MLKSIMTTSKHVVINSNGIHPVSSRILNQSNMSTIRFNKFKGKAKKLVNDETGKHSHGCREKCDIADCSEKKCESLCGSLQEMDILGHTTHNPPIGKYYRVVSDYDADGKPRTQYFVRGKKKVINDNQKKEYSDKEVKTDEKQTKHANSSDEIRKKFEDL